MQQSFNKQLLGVLIFIIYAMGCVLYVFPVLARQEQPNKAQKTLLNLWHIETFEGGLYSRKTYLEKQLRTYEKSHSGLYVHVSTYTLEQALDLLKKGEQFDIISFGTGVGSHFLNSLAVLPDFIDIRADLAKAGRLEGKTYAVPYLLGGYCLVARKVDNPDAIPLLDLIRTPPSQRYSCVYGYGTLNLPFLSLSDIGDLNCFEASTQYQAYKCFLDKSALVLLGTQRDVCKLNNRMSGNSIEELEFYPLSSYTDLVQYLSVSHVTTNYDKCVEILRHLTGIQAQSAIRDLSMCSVLSQKLYQKSDGAMYLLEEALLGKVATVHAFCEGNQLIEFRLRARDYLTGKARPSFIFN